LSKNVCAAFWGVGFPHPGTLWIQNSCISSNRDKVEGEINAVEDGRRLENEGKIRGEKEK